MEIGSDPGCLIHIDSLAVKDKHARIETHGHDSILFDLKTDDGTFVNQNRISEHKLADGDMIRVGKHTLSYKYEEISSLESNESSTSIDITPILDTEQNKSIDDIPEEEPVSSKARQGWLQILNGQNLGKTMALTRSMTNLGKPGVATAVITKRNDGYFISHLEGKYPPKVGNKPIDDRSVKLADGDTITIGNINMQFYLE
jgi:pSer/pThr/pTyr-binding forkhead associated (FHA) protein